MFYVVFGALSMDAATQLDAQKVGSEETAMLFRAAMLAIKKQAACLESKSPCINYLCIYMYIYIHLLIYMIMYMYVCVQESVYVHIYKYEYKYVLQPRV